MLRHKHIATIPSQPVTKAPWSLETTQKFQKDLISYKVDPHNAPARQGLFEAFPELYYLPLLKSSGESIVHDLISQVWPKEVAREGSLKKTVTLTCDTLLCDITALNSQTWQDNEILGWEKQLQDIYTYAKTDPNPPPPLPVLLNILSACTKDLLLSTLQFNPIQNLQNVFKILSQRVVAHCTLLAETYAAPKEYINVMFTSFHNSRLAIDHLEEFPTYFDAYHRKVKTEDFPKVVSQFTAQLEREFSPESANYLIPSHATIHQTSDPYELTVEPVMQALYQRFQDIHHEEKTTVQNFSRFQEKTRRLARGFNPHNLQERRDAITALLDDINKTPTETVSASKLALYIKSTLSSINIAISHSETAWTQMKSDYARLTPQTKEEPWIDECFDDIQDVYNCSKMARERAITARENNKTIREERYANIRETVNETLDMLTTDLSSIASQVAQNTGSIADLYQDLQHAKRDTGEFSTKHLKKWDPLNAKITALNELVHRLENTEPVTFYTTFSQKMAIPAIQRPKLRDFLLTHVMHSELREQIEILYRKKATIGDGGTAAILIEETNQNKPIKCPKSHYPKAQMRSIDLSQLSERDASLTMIEREIIRLLLRDLDYAIRHANATANV